MNKIHKAATAAFVMSCLRRHIGVAAYDSHKLYIAEHPRFGIMKPHTGVFERIESVFTVYGLTQETIEQYLNFSMCWDETRNGSEFWLSQHIEWREECKQVLERLPESWREILDM